jgi:hypothetical protein
MKTLIFGLVVLSAGSAFGQEVSTAPEAKSSRASSPLVLPANTKGPASALVQNGAVIEPKGQQSVVSSTVVRSNEVAVDSQPAGQAAGDPTSARASRVKIPANTAAPGSTQSSAAPMKERPAQD